MLCKCVLATPMVVFMSITFNKTYEVDESLVCERKASDRYASLVL